MPSGDRVRALLQQLAVPETHERWFGRPNRWLAELWRIAWTAAQREGIGFDEAVEAVHRAYQGFPLTAAPYSVLLAESLLGVSDPGGEDAEWMLRMTGTAFAAYGIKPKFKNKNS